MRGHRAASFASRCAVWKYKKIVEKNISASLHKLKVFCTFYNKYYIYRCFIYFALLAVNVSYIRFLKTINSSQYSYVLLWVSLIAFFFIYISQELWNLKFMGTKSQQSLWVLFTDASRLVI